MALNFEGVDNTILVNELQLGEQLNSCIHAKRRSDFSLLLAMLTDDVRAHSQFTLPVTEVDVINTTDDSLRQTFHLPEPAPLALTSTDQLSDFNQASLVAADQLAAIKLQGVLQPQAIAFRDDAKHIAQNVLTNTSLYCQKTHQQSASTLGEHLPFNAKGWLDVVQTSLVKSLLVTA
jgi:hypothetical protein